MLHVPLARRPAEDWHRFPGCRHDPVGELAYRRRAARTYVQNLRTGRPGIHYHPHPLHGRDQRPHCIPHVHEVARLFPVAVNPNRLPPRYVIGENAEALIGFRGGRCGRVLGDVLSG
jgi:hypothetical protein